ncbi:MAG: hypothetical protein JXA67_00060 [Micromonosporaceae bacterium]|nr:hypothetical protein [Micromonosporaceae bacterium]
MSTLEQLWAVVEETSRGEFRCWQAYKAADRRADEADRVVRDQRVTPPYVVSEQVRQARATAWASRDEAVETWMIARDAYRDAAAALDEAGEAAAATAAAAEPQEVPR